MVNLRRLDMDKLSIVVPCYNEQETVNIFYRETTKVVDAMDFCQRWFPR